MKANGPNAYALLIFPLYSLRKEMFALLTKQWWCTEGNTLWAHLFLGNRQLINRVTVFSLQTATDCSLLYPHLKA